MTHAFGLGLLVSLYAELGERQFVDKAERIVFDVDRVLGVPAAFASAKSADVANLSAAALLQPCKLGSTVVEMGHSIQRDQALVRIDVCCCPTSDQIAEKSRMTKRAMRRHFVCASHGIKEFATLRTTKSKSPERSGLQLDVF